MHYKITETTFEIKETMSDVVFSTSDIEKIITDLFLESYNVLKSRRL